MSSIRCPHCGLVNWATAEACKRCKLPLSATPPSATSPAPSAEEAAPPTPPQSVVDVDEAAVQQSSPDEAAAHEPPPFDAPPFETGVAGFHTPPPEDFYAPPPSSPHYASHRPPPRAFGRDWRSPYDTSDADPSRLDIEFEVAPFVDTAMVIRDTFAMTRAQFGLIMRVVLTAIVPQVLLILAFGASQSARPAGLPPGMLSFGAPPVLGRGGAPAPPDLAGLFGLFLLLLVGYQFVRMAVMPSALVYGLVTALNRGETPGVVECYVWGLKRSFSAGFALLLTGFLTFLGMLLLVFPGVFLALSFSMVIPVIAVEGRGAVEAMGRSWDLSRGRRWTIFFSTFAWTVMAFLVTLVATFFLSLFAALLRSDVLGSITTSFVLEVLSATGVVLSLVIYLGIAHYGQTAPAPRGGSMRKTIIVLVAVGVLAVGGFAAIVASVAVPNFKASVRAANEASAIANMRGLIKAEEDFRTLADRYGTLDELAAKHLIDGELAGGVVHGYRFEVDLVGDSFAATATPVTYGSTGTRSFYAAADGVLRVADRHGRKAGPDDMPLNEFRPPRGTRRTDSPIIDPAGRE